MRKISVFIVFVIACLILGGCSKSYIVTFETNGADEIKEVEIKKGEKLTLPTVYKEGYSFDGWYLDTQFNKKYDNKEIDEDITLYAKWKPKAFIVQFVDYDEALIEEMSFEFNDELTFPQDPEREGYKFIEWDNDVDRVTSDLIIKAKYEIESYTVIFNDYENNEISKQTIEYGKSANAPDAPERNGYEFYGWSKDFDNITSDLTINPEYSVIEYNIVYHYHDDTISHFPNKFTINDENKLKPYENDDLVIMEWYLDSDLKEKVTTIPKGTIGDIKVYGKKSIPFTIDYELNGGSWTWTSSTIPDANNGIDSYSNLAQIFMADFYIYLRDNNLLASNKVSNSLHKTNWIDFKKNYDDPVAIYNHTTTNTAQTNDGYSQFFYTSASGNKQTGEVTSISGGFLGTEPYKTKYANLVNHISLLLINKYSESYFWDGPSGKTLFGFVLDGYFYGTQGIGDGLFAQLRSLIPNTNIKYNNNAKAVETTYASFQIYLGRELNLVSPIKDGYVFGGWYDNDQCSGDSLWKLDENIDEVPKLYAKWISISDLK